MIYRRSGLYLTPEPPPHVPPQDCAHVALSAVGPAECSLCGDPPTCGATPVPGLAYDRLCYRNSKEAMTDPTTPPNVCDCGLPKGDFDTRGLPDSAYCWADWRTDGIQPCIERRRARKGLPPDAEDERAPTAEQLANLERAATDGYCTSLTPWITKWIIKRARETERLRAEASGLRLALAMSEKAVFAYQVALAPLLASREPTPENVAEAVMWALEDREAVRAIFMLAEDTAECPLCGMEPPDGELDDYEHQPDCPIGKVATRREPEGRE